MLLKGILRCIDLSLTLHHLVVFVASRHGSDNMGMNSKRHITNMHIEVLCTSKNVRGAAICAFHMEGALGIDPSTNFLYEIFSDDNNL